MKKAIARPTSADLQAAQARADRKLAAMERRADRQAGIVTFSEEVQALYSNTGK